MAHKKFIGANWKMHPAPAGYHEKDSPFRSTATADITVFPSATDIASCLSARLHVGGQCGRAETSGSFTGDISMQQLAIARCSAVLCGHSERRAHYGETDEVMAVQVVSALVQGLTAVLCIGEKTQEKEDGMVQDVLKRQLTPVLSSAEISSDNFIIAYEPVWAIGTGKTPKPEEVQAVHEFIRSLLPDTTIRIIYGGSVNGENAASFLKLKDVDGALVGGASLDTDKFRKIVEGV